MATNVPAIQFTTDGVVLPTEPDILTGVQADINTAFGGGVNPGLSTPQGQLAQSLTAIIGDKNNQIAEVVNQINPDVADGVWQDAIGRIYFMDRIAASGTVVTGTCTGLVGTVIPAGTAAQDSSGYIYYSTASATIGAAGTVDVQFQNSATGPIACAIGALNKIYTSITGWDSVTNAAAGTPGTDVESRSDFENRRKLSVASNSVNSVQSIYGAVLAVNNVLDAYVAENYTASAITYGATNYPMSAHSITVSVAGGVAADIAQAIWSKKAVGCDYNGNTSATVYDTSGYSAPYPQYAVTWLTPTATPVYFAVSIANNSLLPANIVTLIQNAVIASFNGQNGSQRARIGSTIYAGQYYSGIASTDVNVHILSVFMSITASPISSTSLSFGIDQRPTLSASNISVTLV